jgi:hypothetical protein
MATTPPKVPNFVVNASPKSDVVSPKHFAKTSKKVALLMGLNYTGTSAELKGCVNDAKNLRDFLTSKGIVDEVSLKMDPTAKEIFMSLHALALRSYVDELEFVFLSYSGHGGQKPDTSGDEVDGFDECLYPSDYATGGALLDDDLHDLLEAFNPATKVFFLVDACHSGTVLDLKYRYLSRNIVSTENKTDRSENNVFMISGCSDVQSSADSWDAKRKEMTGAMTTSFLDSFAENYSECTKDMFYLLSKMRINLMRKRYSQVPQLSSSMKLTGKVCF